MILFLKFEFRNSGTRVLLEYLGTVSLLQPPQDPQTSEESGYNCTKFLKCLNVHGRMSMRILKN